MSLEHSLQEFSVGDFAFGDDDSAGRHFEVSVNGRIAENSSTNRFHEHNPTSQNQFLRIHHNPLIVKSLILSKFWYQMRDQF